MSGKASVSEQRIARVLKACGELGADALYVRSTTNIQWLTGFENVFDTEQAHAMMLAKGVALLHTDSRYSGACERAAGGTGVTINSQVKSHAAVCMKALGDVLTEERDGKPRTSKCTLAFEDSMTYADYQRLSETCDAMARELAINESILRETRVRDEEVGSVELLPTTNLVFNVRAVKDADEIARMRDAQAITDAAFAYVSQYARPGMTEAEVQRELDDFMLRHGADGLAFASIVATGENGANPHAIPGDTVLEAGQCVVLDFGARARGYCSDMTRMLFLGQPDEEMARAYATIRRANEEVESLIRPGVTGIEMQEHAERVLEECGFGGKMGHGLGHGVGIDIHEEPCLNRRNGNPLVEGNVVTVEPGIYLSGKFGMRLEDFGVVTATGFDRFTQSTHDMVII